MSPFPSCSRTGAGYRLVLRRLGRRPVQRQRGRPVVDRPGHSRATGGLDPARRLRAGAARHAFADGEVIGPVRGARASTPCPPSGSAWCASALPLPDVLHGLERRRRAGAPGRAQPCTSRIGLATSTDGRAGPSATAPPPRARCWPATPPCPRSRWPSASPSCVRDGTGLSHVVRGLRRRTWRIAAARWDDGRAWTREGVALEPGGEGEPDELGARNPLVGRGAAAGSSGIRAEAAPPPLSRAARRQRLRHALHEAAGRVDLRLHPTPSGEEAVQAHSVLVHRRRLRVFFAREKTLRRARPPSGEA